MKTKFILFIFCIISAHLTNAQIYFEKIGDYRTNIFGESATEIIAFDSQEKLIFSTNGFDSSIDIIDIKNPKAPYKYNTIPIGEYGHHANSVDFYGDILAVAVEADKLTNKGEVVFFSREGNFIKKLTVGVMPDMLSFSKDGCYLAIACEGEPTQQFDIDPEGSIAIIDLRNGINQVTQNDVHTTYLGEAILSNKTSILINDNLGHSSVGQDLEPEYVSFDEDSEKLYVCLQENNAIAVIDVESKKVEKIVGLGFKDISAVQNGMDVSDKDNQINITSWPSLFALYQPDAIKCIRIKGIDYILTANEGETRKNKAFKNVSRVNKLKLDTKLKEKIPRINDDDVLGRLKVHNKLGDTDNDGDLDELYTFGARSFSIWDTNLNQIYDSGDIFEKQLAQSSHHLLFNANNSKQNSFDKRSDDKGCEPEGIITFELQNKYYALIGLDRMGGFMCFDITDPHSPSFLEYITDRNFEEDIKDASGLGPEGLLFIDKNSSPTGYPLVLIANEVSGQISIFKVGIL